jgi:hypothetical protein
MNEKIKVRDHVKWTETDYRMCGRIHSELRHGVVFAINGSLATVRSRGGKSKVIALACLAKRNHPNPHPNPIAY